MLALAVGTVSFGLGAALTGALAGSVAMSVVLLDFTGSTLLFVADVSGLTPDLCGRHARNGDVQAGTAPCQPSSI
jgi:hypothetical protein